MNNLSRLLSAILISLLLISCKEEEPIVTDIPNLPDTTDVQIPKINIKGVIQKGPFINGTSITVAELDDSLTATGKIFMTQVANNQGRFATEQIALASHKVQLMANGFYFDEVRGEKSSAPLTLYALAYISDTTTVNVNLLSHLTRDRILYLYQQGESFEAAKWQAQQEILSVFGIAQKELSSAEFLDIAQDGEDNAILLAISAVLQADNTVAELSELLANINTDIKEDGQLDSESLQKKIRDQGKSLKLPAIRQHLTQRYEELGVKAVIPNFEKYIDSDGDGILNKDEEDTPEEFSFALQKKVAIKSQVISNEVEIVGLNERGTSDASVKNATLLVNGTAVSGQLAKVKNGDKLQLQVRASEAYADTVAASLSIGFFTTHFIVVTDEYKADAFSFKTQKEVAVDSVYTSNIITISGLPFATLARIENGKLVKNGTKLKEDTVSVKTGDQLAIRILSSGSYASTTTARLDINGVQGAFTITTDDYKPDEFSFKPVENAKRDSVYISSTITLSGLPHLTPISIDRGTLIINGKIVSTKVATVKDGDQIAVRLASSSAYETTINSLIKIGVSSYKFSTVTLLNPWQRRKHINMRKARGQFTIDGEMYMIDNQMNIYQYSGSKGQWVYKDKFPGKNRTDFVTFSLGQRAYIGSGNNSKPIADPKTGVVIGYENNPESDFWEYDPVSNQWIRKADFPGENIASTTNFTINNKGYVVNGHNSLYNYSRQLWEYDPATDQWNRKADFPGETRHEGAGIGYDGKGYIGSGRKERWNAKNVYGFWIYDPIGDTWTEKPTFTNNLYPKSNSSYIVSNFFVINSKLYFLATNSSGSTIFKRYDPFNELWQNMELPESSLTWWYPFIASGKQSIYMYEGEQTWEFTPTLR